QREHDGIVCREPLRPIAEVEALDAPVSNAERPQPRAIADRSAPRLHEAQRRVDEGTGEPVAGNERTACAPTQREPFAYNGTREAGRPLRRIGVEGGEQHRSPQALIDRTVAT